MQRGTKSSQRAKASMVEIRRDIEFTYRTLFLPRGSKLRCHFELDPVPYNMIRTRFSFLLSTLCLMELAMPLSWQPNSSIFALSHRRRRIDLRSDVLLRVRGGASDKKDLTPKTKRNSQSKTSTKKKSVEAKKARPSTSPWATANVSASSPNYRIQRELKQFLKDPPPNLTVKVGKNIRVWIIQMKGAKNTIYEGETFKLRVSFPAAYPTVPPSVYFLPPHIPVHVSIDGVVRLRSLFIASLTLNAYRSTFTLTVTFASLC